MADYNQYGLSRYIPSPTRREIRQRDGFGCVNCGLAIFQYEHVDPEFHGAEEHNPEFMTLLCGYCNDKKERGILSKEAVKRAMRSPKCIQKGFTFDSFDVGAELPIIYFADSTFKANNEFILLRINGENLVKFEPPEKEGAPFLLSATFYNSSGEKSFWIERNEWFGDIMNWDIEVTGREITIRKGLRELELQITNIPNECFLISRLNMIYKGYRIEANMKKEQILVTFPSGQEREIKGGEAEASANKVIGLDINGNDFIIGLVESTGKSKITQKIDKLVISGKGSITIGSIKNSKGRA